MLIEQLANNWREECVPIFVKRFLVAIGKCEKFENSCANERFSRLNAIYAIFRMPIFTKYMYVLYVCTCVYRASEMEMEIYVIHPQIRRYLSFIQFWSSFVFQSLVSSTLFSILFYGCVLPPDSWHSNLIAGKQQCICYFVCAYITLADWLPGSVDFDRMCVLVCNVMVARWW